MVVVELVISFLFSLCEFFMKKFLVIILRYPKYFTELCTSQDYIVRSPAVHQEITFGCHHWVTAYNIATQTCISDVSNTPIHAFKNVIFNKRCNKKISLSHLQYWSIYIEKVVGRKGAVCDSVALIKN